MSRFIRVYVSEKIGDAVAALKNTGLQIDYVPVKADPARSGSLPRNSGTVYSVGAWRAQDPEFVKYMPESAMTGFEIIDHSSLCPYMLRKISDTLTVVKWPDGYIVEQLPTTEPAPTLQDVFSFATAVNFKIQLFGATADDQSAYLLRMRELGTLIAEECGVSLDDAEKLPPNTVLSPRAAQNFLELETWVSNGCPTEKKEV